MINLDDLPKCPLEARALLVHKYASERAHLAIDYIKGKYPQFKLFENARDFVDYDLLDCMRSDFESLCRVWLFPATEASQELSECLNRILDCSYKSSRDNMRRALELIIVGAFFSHSRISPEDAKGWLNSTRETPFFTRAVKDLTSLERFDRFNMDHNWADTVKRFYWDLCDAVHTKGQKHSLRELQPVHSVINSIPIPAFNEDALRVTLDLYLKTISHIAVILAAYNPILLVGLPLEQKFADNPPLSGFFNEVQSRLLWELIPPQYHFSLNHIVKTDDEVQSILSWIDGLPDRL